MTYISGEIVALLTFILSLFVPVNHVANVNSDNGGASIAATRCVDGLPSLWFTEAAGVSAVLHEAIHAADCARDGRLDGLEEYPRPKTWAEARELWPGATPYCWTGQLQSSPDPSNWKIHPFARAEWSACYGAYLATARATAHATAHVTAMR